MPKTLIVLAHPEQKSFNGTWAGESARLSQLAEHEILWSDLCAMGFDPVERARHYSDPPSPFDPLKAQEQAAETDTTPDDVAAEIDKIRQADRLIFHFPIWWFGPPAILKGWCERALTHGGLHTSDERFDAGRCLGKKALFCVTTGSRTSESRYDGKEGDIQMLLWPLAYSLRYLGMTVLKPKLIHGVHGYFEGDAATALETRLRTSLSDHARTIADFDKLPEIPFNRDSDFDANGSLKPEAPGHSHFIRHQR